MLGTGVEGRMGCSSLGVKGDTWLQRVFEEQRAAEVRGAAEYNHLIVHYHHIPLRLLL